LHLGTVYLSHKSYPGCNAVINITQFVSRSYVRSQNLVLETIVPDSNYTTDLQVPDLVPIQRARHDNSWQEPFLLS
jgi:hypothetical protein